jgi:hypothetical protein
MAEQRRIYYTADLITPDASDTGVYGDPCDEGCGETYENGWIDPDWSQWTIYEDRDGVRPDVWEEDDGDAVEWLAGQLSSRLGAIQECSDTTAYAADAYVHPYEGKSVRMAAHIEGFTDAEIDSAMALVKAV